MGNCCSHLLKYFWISFYIILNKVFSKDKKPNYCRTVAMWQSVYALTNSGKNSLKSLVTKKISDAVNIGSVFTDFLNGFNIHCRKFDGRNNVEKG